MIVIFFNLYLKREGSSDFHFEDRISYSCTSFDVTFRHLDLKMSEVKISSKCARLSKFCAMWLLCKTKQEASSS